MLPMDTTQIILLAVIIVLTIFLVVIGFQVFFVLKDLRKTLFRLNRFFDNVDDLVGQVKKSKKRLNKSEKKSGEVPEKSSQKSKRRQQKFLPKLPKFKKKADASSSDALELNLKSIVSP